MMIEPEASVSAIVFYHPDRAYSTAQEGGGGSSALSDASSEVRRGAVC